MAKIERFEEIVAWQKGMDLCVRIYSISDDGKFARDFGLRDQIRRSVVSIPSNISEGFERESNNQFIYFLQIAKASAGELRTQITLARRLNYIIEEDFKKLNDEVLEVSKVIGGFITYLRNSKKKKLETKNQLSKL